MKREMTLNGPELTGFSFVYVAGSLTFDQMCFGTTNTRLRIAGMNWESLFFRTMTTWCAPLARIEACAQFYDIGSAIDHRRREDFAS